MFSMKTLTSDSENSDNKMLIDSFQPIIESRENILRELQQIEKSLKPVKIEKITQKYMEMVSKTDLPKAVQYLSDAFQDAPTRVRIIREAAFRFVDPEKSERLISTVAKYAKTDMEPLLAITLTRLIINANHLENPPPIVEDFDDSPYPELDYISEVALGLGRVGYLDFYLSKLGGYTKAIEVKDSTRLPKSSKEDKKNMSTFF